MRSDAGRTSRCGASSAARSLFCSRGRQPARRGRIATTLAAVALLAFAAGGCGTSVTGTALTKELAGGDPGAQMEFWHALPTRRAVSNDEAFHALLLFLDADDPAADYPARVSALKARGLLAGGFAEKPEAAVRRGTVAVALARGLKIPGGLTMRLFGPRDRYAEREMEYAGLFPPGSPHQTFSGAEFLGIIGRAEDYQRGREAEAQVPEEVVGVGGRDGPAGRAAAGNGGAAGSADRPVGPATRPASDPGDAVAPLAQPPGGPATRPTPLE